MFPLSTLGFSPFFEQQLTPNDRFLARVVAEHRGAYEVWSAEGLGRAKLAGRLRHEDALTPGVGDWVVLREAPGPEHIALMERVLTRRTCFSRGAAGREARAQVIAANVDLVFAVTGLDADFNVRRLERYLARIFASGAKPAVILNKVDLCPDLPAYLADLECLGVPIFPISALHAEGLDAIRAELKPGLTVALVGSSGAGKSTLVNALLGEARMRTGEVRASDGRGCHVTTHRQLVLLPSGGLLLDSPGMRELQLQDEVGLDEAFGDLTALATCCRFGDCRHQGEPGCAVQAALLAGTLSAARFEHWQKLEREAQANELRHDVHRRRKAERVWGQLSEEVARLRRWKGGKA